MGFRDFDCFNVALLAKNCWWILKKPGSLVAKAVNARYTSVILVSSMHPWSLIPHSFGVVLGRQDLCLKKACGGALEMDKRCNGNVKNFTYMNIELHLLRVMVCSRGFHEPRSPNLESCVGWSFVKYVKFCRRVLTGVQYLLGTRYNHDMEKSNWGGKKIVVSFFIFIQKIIIKIYTWHNLFVGTANE